MPAFSTIALTTISAAGAGFSFAEAGKQNKLAREAQRDAAKALEEARKKLEVNMMKGLSIAKEPYELEREALLQAGATALQAGVEGDPRGAAATAGRVVQAQQAGLARQRAAMSQEMAQLEKLAATEEAALARARATVDLGEAAGAQAAAQDAMRMRQFNIQQGFSQLGSGLSGLATSGLLDGKKAGGETPDPFAGFQGGQAPSVGVNLSQFQGYDLSGAIGNNDTIDFKSMSIFPQPQLS